MLLSSTLKALKIALPLLGAMRVSIGVRVGPFVCIEASRIAHGVSHEEAWGLRVLQFRDVAMDWDANPRPGAPPT